MATGGPQSIIGTVSRRRRFKRPTTFRCCRSPDYVSSTWIISRSTSTGISIIAWTRSLARLPTSQSRSSGILRDIEPRSRRLATSLGATIDLGLPGAHNPGYGRHHGSRLGQTRMSFTLIYTPLTSPPFQLQNTGHAQQS